MRDKLCVCERRIKILELLRANRKMTRKNLANELNVSTRTITRDILYLSRIAPISMLDGVHGGIYMEFEYKQYSLYLSDEEETCLYSVMDETNQERKEVIRGIILKFTRNTAFKTQNPP